MKILVTGAMGYVGVPLCRSLFRRHIVIGIDLGLFPPIDPIYPWWWVFCDVRDVTEELVEGVDAIVHLAALSNDASSDAFTDAATEINVRAIERLVKMCPSAHHILASSASVYGAAKKVVNETSPLNPLSHYAETKRQAEEVVRTAAAYTIFRFGTLYGPSPSMRTDLVANTMSLTSPIEAMSAHRALTSLYSAVRAIRVALVKGPANDTFNIVDVNRHLYALAEEIARTRQTIWDENVFVTRVRARDPRSYQVSNAKAKAAGYMPSTSEQEYEQLHASRLSELCHFTGSRRHALLASAGKRAPWLKLALQNGILDEHLRPR